MPRPIWTPKVYERLVVSCSACLCLLILTGCITIGVLEGKIGAEVLGSAKGAAVGTGLLGLAAIFGRIIVR